VHDRQVDPGAVSTAAARRLPAAIAVLLAVVVLVGSQLPLAWAVHAQHRQYHPDLEFTGTLPLYLDDAAADWSFMRQAKDGRFFLSDLYAVDEHPRNYVNVLLWALGTFARVFGADVVVVYNVAKVVLGALLLWLLFRLSRRLFDRPGEATACFFMLVLAGGWEGPVAFLQRNAGATWSASSPGWWMPEISTVFSMVLFPHLTAGFAAMVAVILLMLKAWRRDDAAPRARAVASAGAGAVVFALALFHPFDAVTALGTIWTAPLLIGLAERRWPRGEAVHALIASLVAAPAVGYDLFLVATNPAIRAWHAQGVMTTPEAGALLMALGVNLPLAALLLPRFRSLGRPHLALLSWLAAAIVLIHLPLPFQRRMMGGIQFPLAALACTSIALVLAPRLGSALRLPRDWIVAALVVLVAPLNVLTPFYVHQQQWREVARLNYPSWLSTEEREALRRLDSIAPRGAKALASYDTGNLVPPFAGIATYVGHNALTVDAKARRKDVERFFAAGPEDDAWRQELLRRWGIGFVIYTARERALGDFDPSTRPWLQEVFVTGEVPARRAAVYRLR
jgi:uncharacterized membrane protein